MLGRLATFIGEVARPWCLIVASSGAGYATIRLANSALDGRTSLTEAAIYIGAAWAGVAALYAPKAWEETIKAKSADQNRNP